jgi:16S rRNA (guanine966-N2)-methyltransferase
MKLRVIAGEFGGRPLEAPKGFATHPMSERMKNALFNKLGDISGFEVLDAFAGSGALSFEAVSRGAGRATAVERDRSAAGVIKRNIETLEVGTRVKLIEANVHSWSETSAGKKFDLIICDPPYNDFKLSTVNLLINHLKPNALMVLSYPGRETVPAVDGVVVVDKSLYGDSALAIYRKGGAK